jgi:hypothetical protein
MKKHPALVLALLALASCKEKEKTPDTAYISVPSLIRSQVAHVDTSLYSIEKYVVTDTLKPDTSYIPREGFRAEAKAFLDLPDLSDPRVAKRFREEPARYDESLDRVMITYLPKDSINEEFKSIELIISPNVATGDKVRNILVKRVIGNRDGFMQKNMIWIMDRSFQVTEISQEPGQPEKTTTTRVVWNEDRTWSEEMDAENALQKEEKIK